MKIHYRVVCLLAVVLSLIAANSSRAGLMHNAGTTPGQAYLDYAENFPFVGWIALC